MAFGRSPRMSFLPPPEPSAPPKRPPVPCTPTKARPKSASPPAAPPAPKSASPARVRSPPRTVLSAQRLAAVEAALRATPATTARQKPKAPPSAVPVTGGTAKAEHTEPGAAERLGADALERIGAAVSLFDIRTLGRAARVNRAWCAAFGAALHSLPQRTAEARASLEHSELLRRPVCWAERRRATVLRLSSSRSSHGLLRDVCALHRSVPTGWRPRQCGCSRCQQH